MTATHRTLLVVALALATVVAGATVAVAAQEETPTATEDATTPTDTEGTEEVFTPTEEGETETEEGVTPAGEANVTFVNKTSNASAVEVDSVTVPDGGFVLIYTLNDSAVQNGGAAATTTAADTPLDETETTAGAEATGTATEAGVTETEEDVTEAGVTETEEDVTETAAGVETTTAGDGQVVTSIEDVDAATLDMNVGNSTYLESGTHENVTVQFDGQMVEDQILIAVAYQDINQNQTYDGLKIEAPYTTDDGDLIADWAYVSLVEEEETPTEDGAAATATEDGAAATATEAGDTETEGGVTPAEETETGTEAAGVTETEAGVTDTEADEEVGTTETEAGATEAVEETTTTE